MSRRGMVLMLLLCAAVTTSLGCQATVPKKDFDAVNARAGQLAMENQQLQDELEGLRRKQGPDLATLKSEMGPDVDVVMRYNQPTVVVESELLYASGEAKIKSRGKQVLSRVGRVLKTRFPDYMIRVEGHTDTDPIRRTRNKYRNNWELGAKRATEVVDYLVTNAGLDPKRIYAASFSMYQPISTQKNRNRRVEIVVVPGAPAVSPGLSPVPEPMGEPARTTSTLGEEPK